MHKKQIRTTLLLLCMLLPLVSTASVEDPSQLIDRIVAVVDQEVILWSELNVRLDVFLRYSGYSFTPPEQELDRLRGQLLDEMIDEQVLILKAKRDSIVIENSRVEELLVTKLSEMKVEAGSDNFPKMLERIGFSERQLKNQLRKSIRDQLLMEQMQRVLASRVNITYRDVEAFRRAHVDSLPTTIYVSLIFVKIKPDSAALSEVLQKVEIVQSRLQAGDDFADLARTYSEDPGSQAEGGYLDCFGTGEFLPEFERAAFALKPGEISEPVRTQFGYHLILLHEKREDELCASHILVRTETNQGDEERVLAQLQGLRERTLAGEDFAELAREYSEDPSAELGGLWNTFDKNQIPAFLQPHLADVKLGGVSDPFILEDGGALIKINDDQATLERLIRERRIPQTMEKVITEFKEQIHLERRSEEIAKQ